MLDDMAWCRAPKPALPRMKREIARALVAEASKDGMRAIVHAPNLADAREAVADGARRSRTGCSTGSTPERSRK